MEYTISLRLVNNLGFKAVSHYAEFSDLCANKDSLFITLIYTPDISRHASKFVCCLYTRLTNTWYTV
jgi:hypothetical protein